MWILWGLGGLTRVVPLLVGEQCVASPGGVDDGEMCRDGLEAGEKEEDGGRKGW